jgi:chitodextrinase
MRWTIALASLAMAGLFGATAGIAQETQNSITLTWTATGDDSLTGIASQYDLRYSTSPITAANFGSAPRWTAMPAPTSPGTSQNVTVTGLTPSTTYYFVLKVGDEVPNWSALSNVITRTTLALDSSPPAALSTVAISAFTENSVSLTWNATGDDGSTGTAAAYDVRFSTAPITDANWASATQASGEPAPAPPGTAQNFTITGLTRETTYYFAIRVRDEADNSSSLSNPVQATTPDQTAPAAVNDLTIGS